MKDDLEFVKLWDLYSPLLTQTQREITALFFNYDLSVGEIAEEKGVSRQSVSDCLQKCRKQLQKYEEKLGFSKALDALSAEYSAYMTETQRFIAGNKEKYPVLRSLSERLDKVHTEFGVETLDLDDENRIVGKVFLEEEL